MASSTEFDKYLPYVDMVLWSEDKAERHMQDMKQKYGLNLQQLLMIMTLLYAQMGDNVSYSRAMQVGYVNARQQMAQVLDDFYRRLVYPDITVYLKGIYVGGYQSSVNRLPASLQEKALPFLQDKFVSEQINVRWAGDGKLYSDRIWEHKDKLKASMDRILHESIVSGKDVKKTSRAFASEMDTAYNNAERLVRTETNFVLNQSQLDAMVRTGVNEYEYVAYLDKRTSHQCRSLDGKIFQTSQAVVGVNYPPLHPNCRSTVMPYQDLEE